MSGPSAAAGSLPHRRPLLFSAALAVPAALLAAAGAGPVAAVGLPVLLGALLALGGSNLVFLWILAASSGIGLSWADWGVLHVGGNPINVSGLHWGGIFLVCAALLVRDGFPTLPRPLRFYLAFAVLAWAGIAWTTDAFEGVKQAMQLGAPLLIGAVALNTLGTRADIERLRAGLLVGLALAAGMTLLIAAAGIVVVDTPGLAGPLGNRSLAIYLVPLMALALGSLRHRAGGWAVAAAGVGFLAVLTLSRMVVAAMLALTWLSTAGKHPAWKLAAGAAAVLGFVLALQFAPLRDRFFDASARAFDPSDVRITGRGEDAQLSVGGLKLSGREILWVLTARHAMEAPILGHGTGASHRYLAVEQRQVTGHPHNDYLRVLHDLGAVGLVLFLLAAVGLWRLLFRLHRHAGTPLARELALAAGLAWVGYLLVALTDNVIVYVAFFTQNVFLLIAMALRAYELEAEEPSSDDPPGAARGAPLQAGSPA